MTSRNMIGQEAAAKALGVSARQFRRWLVETWFPAEAVDGGKYDVPAIRAARDAMGRKGSEESDQSKTIKLATDRAKLQLARIETQTRGLNLQQRKKELLPRRDWELKAAELLTQLSDWCEQLPAMIAADLPKRHRAKLRQRLKEELDCRRRKLRNELERQARKNDQAGKSRGHRRSG